MELKSVPIQLYEGVGNGLLSDPSTANLMQDVTSKIIDNTQEKRKKIITQRLKEIVGIELSFEEEAKRRFKRLAIEYNGSEETIYFNDGSEQGKRIITFVCEEQPITFENGICEIRFAYSYY